MACANAEKGKTSHYCHAAKQHHVCALQELIPGKAKSGGPKRLKANKYMHF
jgi:hypothetical protein